MSETADNLDDLLAEVESAMSGEETPAGSPKSPSKYAVAKESGAGEVEMAAVREDAAPARADDAPPRKARRRNSAFSLPKDFKPPDAAHDTPAQRAHSAFVGTSTSVIDEDSDSDAESDAGGDSGGGCDRCLMGYHVRAREARKCTLNPYFDQFIIIVILVAGVLVGV